MRVHVSNRSRSPRGVELEDGSTRFVEPGETAILDLARHPLHDAWAASGELSIEPIPSPPEKAARRGRSGSGSDSAPAVSPRRTGTDRSEVP